MAIGYGVACPKPKTNRQLKAKRDREDAKALRQFQDAVWAKALSNGLWGYAFCADCDAAVSRDGIYKPLGHVHHLISRRHKATRHDPENGILLCRACHNKRHRREF